MFSCPHGHDRTSKGRLSPLCPLVDTASAESQAMPALWPTISAGGAGVNASQASPVASEAVRSSRSLYQRQYPERHAAHVAVQKALAAGKLAKPALCSRCSRYKRLDAHHDDYSEPLVIRWLCRPCHTFVHPKTQKNVGPVWRWEMTATAEDIAAAMKRARTAACECCTPCVVQA